MGRTSAEGRQNGVRAARTALRLTQSELAETVGVTRQTAVAVEAGDYAPSGLIAAFLVGAARVAPSGGFLGGAVRGGVLGGSVALVFLLRSGVRGRLRQRSSTA